MNPHTAIIQQTPHLFFEAAFAIRTRGSHIAETIIKNHANYGLSEAEMQAMLAPQIAYRDACMADILPLLAENEDLLPFLDVSLSSEESETDDSIAVLLTRSAPDACWDAYTPDEVDRLATRVTGWLIAELTDEPDDALPIDTLLAYIYEDQGLGDGQKLLLIRFVTNRQALTLRLHALLSAAAAIVSAHLPIIEPDLTAYLQTISADPSFADTVLGKMHIAGLECQGDLRVFVSIFSFNSCGVTANDVLTDLYVGLHVLHLFDLHEEHAMDSVQELKALSDGTRWRIVRLLARESLYLSEIAERMELTSATVSHHLDVLMQARLLHLATEGERARRVRYSADPNVLHQIAEKIHHVAKEAEHDSV